MNTKLPTLTTNKILENDSLIINKLYEYFLASEYSQTFFYKPHVASLKYLIGEYEVDDDELEEAVRSTLTTLYERYFDEVEVTCIVEPEEENTNNYGIKINIEIVNNGIAKALNRTVSISENKINYFKTYNVLLYKKELR